MRRLVGLCVALVGCGATTSASQGSVTDVAPSLDTSGASLDVAASEDTSDAATITDTALEPDVAVAPDTAAEADVGPESDVVAPPDAPPPVDSGAAGVDSPFGPIDGACGAVLSAELSSNAPSFYVNTWHLDSATLDTTKLAPKPQQRFAGPNAGGSSKCSEIMSMELLSACEAASTYKLEVEVDYDVIGNLTDYIAEKDGVRVGVSVSRAYLGPMVSTYTDADAVKLLTKKLEGINESTLNVSAADTWQKQVLHIFTLHADWAGVLETAWAGLDGALKADTIVLVTVEDGAGWIVTDTCDE
jgi:hypothetical protein